MRDVRMQQGIKDSLTKAARAGGPLNKAAADPEAEVERLTLAFVTELREAFGGTDVLRGLFAAIAVEREDGGLLEGT